MEEEARSVIGRRAARGGRGGRADRVAIWREGEGEGEEAVLGKKEESTELTSEILKSAAQRPLFIRSSQLKRLKARSESIVTDL